jgi:hypothetical protein
MFKVAQVKPYGATLTNGFLPTTSPDHAPVYSEDEVTQVMQGNWYHDGFYNLGKNLQYDIGKGGRPLVSWNEWSPDSADLAKTSLTSGYNSWELMREGMRPFKNQMFPSRIFDQDNQEVIDALPGRVRAIR